MVLFPKGGLGRFLLVILIISTVSYLVLNIVSFAGNRWITYVDVPVRFGLWRVCDTTIAGLCNAWANPFISSITDILFNSSKPDFIRSSQALEIISLVFYVLAALFIIIGLLNVRVFPYERSFLVAIGLLFISIVFVSATLGIMSVQGRNNRPLAFHDWAWWNGLVGLIMTIIAWITLIGLIIYLRHSTSSRSSPKDQPWNSQSNPPMINTNYILPYYQGNSFENGLYPNNNSYSAVNPMMTYGEEYPSMNYPNGDLSMYYSSQNPSVNYYNEQNPSTMITELARQYVNQAYDQQYQTQLLQSYGQFYQNPYTINSYF